MDRKSSPNRIRIVIADDHPVFRRGLRAILDADSDLNILAEADNGASAIALIKQHSPDVAILDVDMPLGGGMSVARAVREHALSTAVVFLTMHKDESVFNAAIEAGVKGYLLKDSALGEIASCIKAVAEGRTFISPELSGYLLRRGSRAQSLANSKPGLSALTASERRILGLIAVSKTNKQIAEELFISVRTVEHHREHICEKLDLRGSHALLSFAIEHKGDI